MRSPIKVTKLIKTYLINTLRAVVDLKIDLLRSETPNVLFMNLLNYFTFVMTYHASQHVKFFPSPKDNLFIFTFEVSGGQN